jgi:hypothetical protein
MPAITTGDSKTLIHLKSNRNPSKKAGRSIAKLSPAGLKKISVSNRNDVNNRTYTTERLRTHKSVFGILRLGNITKFGRQEDE